MSIEKGMDKEDAVHITFDYYWAIKKNEVMLFAATQLGREIVIQNEVRERQTLRNPACMQNLENGADELICKAKVESQMQKTNTYGYQEGKGGGMNQETRIDINTVLTLNR